jgi:hypothetical protein
VVEVQILDPYNPQETLKDKLTIVDVKARDAAGPIFQIEIQLLVFAELSTRMLYVRRQEWAPRPHRVSS